MPDLHKFVNSDFNTQKVALVPGWLYALRLIPATLPGKARLARLLLKHAALRGPVAISVGGLKLRVPSALEPVAYHLIADGVYDGDTCAVLKQSLRPDSVLLDVGANIGAMSIAAARDWCPKGRVVGIEASPSIYQYLDHNVNSNSMQGVTLLHRAVTSSTGGTLSFYDAPDAKFGMGSLADRFGCKETQVPTITLDDVVSELGIEHVNVIKVDVEGFELEVFQGARRLLQQDPAPIIVFEFNDWAEERKGCVRAGDAQRFLRSQGYRTVAIAQFLRGNRTELPVVEHGGGDFVAFKQTHP